jgi:hypothetical protein
MNHKKQLFGETVWENLQKTPFGSLTKRELEILVLKAAIDAGLIDNHPVNMAASLRISLTKSNAYLTDISLRNPIIEDKTALLEILKLLPTHEIITADLHLSIPINNVSLRIWLERKIALIGLNPGESLRKDVIKITPAGLYKILDNSEGIISPEKAIIQLSKVFGNEIWFKEAKQNWQPETTWKDLLTTASEIGSIAASFKTLLPFLSQIISL